jgi:hypothetical protein
LCRGLYFVQFFAIMVGREVCPASMPELTGLGTILLASDFLGRRPETISQLVRLSLSQKAINQGKSLKSHRDVSPVDDLEQIFASVSSCAGKSGNQFC